MGNPPGRSGGGGAGAATAMGVPGSFQGRGGLASRLNFVKPPGHDLSVVHIDVAKLDANLAATPSFHVGPGGVGASAIGGRYAEAHRFLTEAARSGKPVYMTRIYVDKQGDASISDGRHRFAVLRDTGATTIPVVVPRSNAARVRRLYGAG
jgi:hypothetical protein